MKRALLGVLLSLASCRGHERTRPPPVEPISIEGALYAAEGTWPEIVAMTQLSASTRLPPRYVALLGVETAAASKEPAAVAPRSFERYLFIAREAMFGVVKDEPLEHAVPIVLVAGRTPPCFGSARRRSLVAGPHGPLSEVLVVTDCPHPAGYYGATAIRGAAGATVTLVDQPLPALGAARAEVLIVRGRERYFIAPVKDAVGFQSATQLIRELPDGSLAVVQTLPR